MTRLSRKMALLSSAVAAALVLASPLLAEPAQEAPADQSATAVESTANAPRNRKEVRLTSAQLDRCVGRYELTPDLVLTITRDGEHLLSQWTGNAEPAEIFAESETEFFVKVVDAQVTFRFEGEGPAKGVVVHQNGNDLPARRIE